jgi:hypothetical protein
MWQPHTWTLGIVFIEGHIFLFHGATTHSGSWSPNCRNITIGRTPLDEWSARSSDLYLHNTHKRQTSMPPAGFEAAIPASERPQTHALDRAATRIGTVDGYANMNNSCGRKRIYPSTGLRATCFSRERKRIWFWSLRLTVNENWHPRPKWVARNNNGQSACQPCDAKLWCIYHVLAAEDVKGEF